MVFHPHIALLAILMTTSTVTAQEKTRIYVGAPSKTGYSPLVATKRGFFEQQGLDVQLVLLRGMPITVQALAVGSLHFAPEGRNLISKQPSVGSIHYHWGRHQRHRSIHHVGKNYKSYEDLRGATFGTASLTGGTITALREALKVMGL